MVPANEIKQRAAALAERDWDLPAIEDRFRHLLNHDIPQNRPEPDRLIRERDKFLDQVQLRAEQYCYLTRSCAKGSCLALLEAFGLGNMEIIRAMAPFPGLAMSGGICGPVAGGLAALGLYFSDKDPANIENVDHYIAGRQFVSRFGALFGSLLCADIQKQLLGKTYDPFSGPRGAHSVQPGRRPGEMPLSSAGLGARIAADIIIASMEKSASEKNRGS